MGDLASLKQNPGATPHSACSRHRHDRVTGKSPLALTGRRRLPVIGEIDFRLTHRLPGKLAEGTSSLPFGKLSWRGYYGLKIRTATSWGADKYVERSVMWVGYRRSRLSRGYTESKRIAIWWPDHTEPTAQKGPLRQITLLVKNHSYFLHSHLHVLSAEPVTQYIAIKWMNEIKLLGLQLLRARKKI